MAGQTTNHFVYFWGYLIYLETGYIAFATIWELCSALESTPTLPLDTSTSWYCQGCRRGTIAGWPRLKEQRLRGMSSF